MITPVSDEIAAAEIVGDPQADDADDRTTLEWALVVDRRAERRVRWVRVLAFGVLPGLALAMAGGAGYLKWQYDSARESAVAQAQSVAAATQTTIALLSYRADTAEEQLTDARESLTGTFRDSYSALIHDIVIPGAQQQKISAVATVPAVASVSASAKRAVVLVFVDQTVTVGSAAPIKTASSVKVTLDRIGDRWLISDFTPV